MSAVDKFQLLITADAGGAIREFDKVGKAAEKDLGKAEERIDKISSQMQRFGAAATVGGAVAARGLFVAAQATQSLADSADKATAVFGQGGMSGLQQFAAGAADSMGRSKAAALDAASAYGLLLKQTGVGGAALASSSAALATRTADLAERFKKPYEEVQKAIEATIKTGSAKSLKGLLGVGIQIDPATLTGLDTAAKTTKVFDEVMRQTADSAGFFATSTDDLGVQLDKANAKAENAKAAFGEAALPAITALADAGSKLLNVFSGLPDGLQSAIGSVAVIGTGLALIGGPLATVGGAVMRATDGFSQMRSKMVDATGASTGLAKGLGGIGSALAVFAASEAIFAIGNQLSGVDRIVSNVTDKLKVLESEGQLGSKAATDAIAEQLKAKIGELDISNIWGDFGANVSSSTLGFDNSIERVQKALDSISSEKAKEQILNIIEGDTASMDRSSEAYQTNTRFIATNRQELNDHAQAAAVAAGAVDGLGAATDEASGKVDKLAEAMRNVNNISPTGVSGFTALASQLSSTFGVIDGLASANDRLTTAQEKLKESAKKDSTAVVNAYDGLAKAKQRLNDVLNEGSDNLSQISPEVELANARKRLMQANADLAASPGNAGAVTRKDEALADIERAIKRRQDLAKSAKDRNRQIADAQQGVSDAQKRVSEATTTGGVGSPEYLAAQKEVADAQRGVALAILNFKGAMDDGTVPLETIAADLQDLANAGLIPQALADTMKSQVAALAGQVGQATSALGTLAGAVGAASSSVAGGRGNVIPPQTVPRNGPARDPYNNSGPRGSRASVVTLDQFKQGIKMRTEGEFKFKKIQPDEVAFVKDLESRRDAGAANDMIAFFKARGGKIGGYARGGLVPGAATSRDTIPAMLTPGEVVMNRNAVASLGADNLLALNAGYRTNVRPKTGGNTTSAARSGDVVNIQITEATSARRTAEEVVRERRKRAFLGGN